VKYVNLRYSYGIRENKGECFLKKAMLLGLLLSLMIGSSALAQTATATASASTSASSVSFFFAACQNQAVIDLNGTMLAGEDVYVQVFDQLGGQGQALSGLIRVSVSGDYQVSAVVPFADGRTLLLGQFASAAIRIASETDAEDSSYTGTIDDVQDGCIEPAYGAADTDTAGGGGNTSSTPLIDPATGQVIVQGELISSANIFTPGGGVLNDIYSFPQEAIVQVGARPSELQSNQQIAGRSTDTGLIFAECDQYPRANPGRLFDTDNLTVFWSWYASTAALAQEHIDTAQYEVFLSSPYGFRQTFPNVVVSPITQREDGNYYVFYTANLGDAFRPGDYKIDFYLTWSRAISDGYADFGPETATPSITSSCSFELELNPFGTRTPLDNPTVPLQR
jgi:hypothetical protein